MPRTQVLRGPSGVLLDDVSIADRPWSRARGLLGRDGLGPREGLLIRRASRVHTFGMRFPIDVIFCDASMRVMGVQTLAPNRLSRRFRGARHCLEAAAGWAGAAGIAAGVDLKLEDA